MLNQLKNYDGEDIFPITKPECVLFEDDDNLNDKIHNIEKLIYGENTKKILTTNGYGLIDLNNTNPKILSLKGKTVKKEKEGNTILLHSGKDNIKIIIRDDNNKNLFYGENELGTIIQVDGSLADNDKCIRTKEFIKVKPNTKYTISNNNEYSPEIYCYSADKSIVEYISSKRTFTTPSDCEFIKWRSIIKANQNDVTTKWQLEEGSERTDYVEPKFYEKTINIELKSLPENISDTVENINNEHHLIKRTEELTLTDEHVTPLSQNGINENFYKFGLLLSTDSSVSYEDFNYVKGSSNFYCNHFNSYGHSSEFQDKEGVSLSNLGGGGGVTRPALIVVASKEKVKDNIDSVKEWLRNNPLVIVYELKNSIDNIINNIVIDKIKYEQGSLIINSGDAQSEIELELSNGLLSEINSLNNKIDNISNVAESINNILDKIV